MANRFNDEETAHGIPEAVFPLWFSDISNFEVVKSHTRIVYRVQADGKTCYLKVIPESDQKDAHPLDRTRYDRSTHFARHLVEAGAPIARPMVSSQGNAVEVQPFSNVEMVVQVSSEVVGTEVSAECRDTNVFSRCGTALARFHKAAESYPHTSQFDTGAWEAEWTETKQIMAGDDPVLTAEFERIDAWLNENTPLPGGKGITHGDTNVFNFIDDGSRVSIIDFDSPMFTWYATDLAYPFRNDKTMSPAERAELWSAFQSGYNAIRPIDIDYETIRWMLRQWMLVTYVSYADMPDHHKKPYLKRWYASIEDPTRW
jgi:Ser/Thr protein kinase RdoA (MazF antagonist)